MRARRMKHTEAALVYFIWMVGRIGVLRQSLKPFSNDI